MSPQSLAHWSALLAPDIAATTLNEAMPTSSDRGPSTSSFRPTLLLSIAKSAMACEFEVLLNQGQYEQGADRALEALLIVEQLEQKLSVYKPRSELSLLNRFGSERAVGISVDTQRLLELARAVHDWTGGAFDITAGSLSQAWGFSQRQGKKPASGDLQRALDCVGTKYVLLDSEEQTARLTKSGVSVNPGAIGKGYALDRAVGKLRDAGVDDFMIHGGMSSVAARGDRHHQEVGGGWLVALKHPWRWEEQLGTIRLRDQALATSGSGKQFFHFGGKRYSHIIDPRSGWPAQGTMSVTVICDSSAIADALATAFFVMGTDATREFCEVQPSVAAIIVRQLPQSGKQVIETVNVSDDMWLPGRASAKN